MDKIDKQILSLLQENSALTNQELAEKVSLSPSPCLRRVKLLEEKGYIKRYVALLDQAQLALTLTAFVSVGLEKHDPKIMSDFEKAIKTLPEVTQCFLITGQTADYLLKVVVSDMQHFQRFLLKRLTRIEGVDSVQSSFVMQRVVDETALPLDFIG